MKFLLFNILAAGILIGARIIGHAWICRRSNKIKMKKTIIVLAVIMALVSCTKTVVNITPTPKPMPDTSMTHIYTPEN